MSDAGGVTISRPRKKPRGGNKKTRGIVADWSPITDRDIEAALAEVIRGSRSDLARLAAIRELRQLRVGNGIGKPRGAVPKDDGTDAKGPTVLDELSAIRQGRE